jgi:hypothetical protein
MITVNKDAKNEIIKSTAEAKRQASYKEEADPLFFKWQRGEATQQEYFNKVQEIRDRYPYPGEE